MAGADLPAPDGAAKGADIVLITIDTLRADALGFTGNGKVQTPVLDRMAAAGRVYPDTHAHNVVTLPSHTNILTGLYPFQHGVRDNSGFVLAAKVPTLATMLHDAGYSTAAFVGAYPLDSRFGLNRGFDVYDDHYPQGTNPDEFVIAERRGDAVVAAALAWWNAPHASDANPRSRASSGCTSTIRTRPTIRPSRSPAATAMRSTWARWRRSTRSWRRFSRRTSTAGSGRRWW